MNAFIKLVSLEDNSPKPHGFSWFCRRCGASSMWSAHKVMQHHMDEHRGLKPELALVYLQ